MERRFTDRRDAGRRLGELLVTRDWIRPYVVGLPRGGVIVAAEVARALGATCEVYVAAKLPAPGQPEYAVGATTEDGTTVWGPDADRLLADPGTRAALVEATLAEVRRRVTTYRADRAVPDLTGRDVVCVDDGLATGLTATAAVLGLRTHRPRSLVLAVPVCPAGSARALATHADEVMCLRTPASFGAVGAWYREFRQVTDAEVLAALTRP